MGKKRITRRTFAAAAAGTVVAGCKTLDSGSSKTLDDATAAASIVSAKIHPAIGVARLGSSTAADGYYIGPEVTTPPAMAADAMRDGAGALKRQAARFRVFGYDANGNVVAELTPDDATIQWRVHLANRKAQWYRFLAALDIPEAGQMAAPRRNPAVTGAARAQLAIDPGAMTIGGKNTAGAAYQCNGTFQGTAVTLGELRTDDAGRLVVLGGFGKSGSPGNTPIFNPADGDTFNNADGWYDDTADGPVTATVTIAGQTLPVDGAWVIVTPPNYAPDVVGWRTLYDLLVDTFTEAGMLEFPAKTSFRRDVYPVLSRLAGLAWVNKGFLTRHGKGSANDFSDPAVIAKLADKTQSAALRQDVMKAFRTASANLNDRKAWPMIYGDAFGSFDNTPRVSLAVSDPRARHLARWLAGDFDSDWDGAEAEPQDLSAVALADQPAMLDRAALHFCLADAFHPGCEVTWPMRHASMFQAPFRIKARGDDEAEPDFGDTLVGATVAGAGGPLAAQPPGGLTRWMALPWQGDTAFCRSGYEPELDPYLPTFWPARVPNQVLTEADYATVMDTSLPKVQRLAAFQNRPSWVRALTGGPVEQMLQMVAKFGAMGLVVRRPGPAGDPDFPAVMMVESLPPGVVLPSGAALVDAGNDPVAQAGWESAEQLAAFRKVMGLRK